MDPQRICRSSLSATQSNTNATRPASCKSRRAGPYSFLANMGLFRARLLDCRWRISGGRGDCLCLVFVCASLRSPSPRQFAFTPTYASPKPPQIRDSKLRCQHDVLGSCIRDGAAITIWRYSAANCMRTKHSEPDAKRRREIKQEGSVHDRGDQRGYTGHPRNATSCPVLPRARV